MHSPRTAEKQAGYEIEDVHSFDRQITFRAEENIWSRMSEIRSVIFASCHPA
jgi:hypothetical protein